MSILVDYDGTISRHDIGDELLARHFEDAALLVAKDREYDAGLVGSRELMRWDMDVLPRDAARLRAEAAEMAQDEAFPGFVAVAEARGIAVEVVSDGLGFYVADNLARLGLSHLPLATNDNPVEGGGACMSFPYGHPHCFVCGTCKRERVRAHQALGRVVAYIGDGTSDRYAAFHAEVVLAKGPLAGHCEAVGWPYQAWSDFRQLTAWLEAAEGSDWPASWEEVAAWRAAHPSMAARTAAGAGLAAHGPRPWEAFMCGPEAWGPGREKPPR
ncbi:MAG TPA: haloacid dehalogenase-like hydrolase [Candidatus Dormibacteraeota bacterium]|nr:haloacid dehalogenase-like hydrolase [Candidatus Dormibacteraeota bacterium]